jgi:hypothetical protein
MIALFVLMSGISRKSRKIVTLSDLTHSLFARTALLYHHCNCYMCMSVPSWFHNLLVNIGDDTMSNVRISAEISKIPYSESCNVINMNGIPILSSTSCSTLSRANLCQVSATAQLSSFCKSIWTSKQISGTCRNLPAQNTLMNCAEQIFSISLLELINILMASCTAKLEQMSSITRDAIRSRILTIAQIPVKLALQVT